MYFNSTYLLNVNIGTIICWILIYIYIHIKIFHSLNSFHFHVSICDHFSSSWKTPFSTSCMSDLPVMNSLFLFSLIMYLFQYKFWKVILLGIKFYIASNFLFCIVEMLILLSFGLYHFLWEVSCQTYCCSFQGNKGLAFLKIFCLFWVLVVWLWCA